MNHYLTTTTEQFCSCFQKGAKIALALHFWYREFGLISYLSNAQLKTISDYNGLLVSLWIPNGSCNIVFCSDWLSILFRFDNTRWKIVLSTSYNQTSYGEPKAYVDNCVVEGSKEEQRWYVFIAPERYRPKLFSLSTAPSDPSKSHPFSLLLKLLTNQAPLRSILV